jgi:hypothetical protein
MAFAVLAEDYAGDCCDLRAVKENVCGLTAICMDSRDIGEGVKSSGGTLAS